MTVLIGMIGALLIIIAFIGGVVFGREFVGKTKPVEKMELSDEQKELIRRQTEQIETENKAFQELLSYSVDVPYNYGLDAMKK